MAIIKQIQIGTSAYDIGAKYTAGGVNIEQELNGKINNTGEEICSDLTLISEDTTVGNNNTFSVRSPRSDGSFDNAYFRPGTGSGAVFAYASRTSSESDFTQQNYLQLTATESILNKPLTIGSGGTGANTKAAARTNLGVSLADRIETTNGSFRAYSGTYDGETALYLLAYDSSGNRVTEGTTTPFILGSSANPMTRMYANRFTITDTPEDGVGRSSTFYIGTDGAARIWHYKDGTGYNSIIFGETSTSLGQPLTIGSGGTGGTTRLEAADNLRFSSLTIGTALTDGSNLNNITTFGNYYLGSNSYTITNSPTTSLYDLTVGCLRNNATYLYQRIITNKNGTIYYRSRQGASASWSDWYTIKPGDYLPLSGGTVTGATKFNSTVTIGSAKFTYDSTNNALKLSFV